MVLIVSMTKRTVTKGKKCEVRGLEEMPYKNGKDE